MLIVCKFSTSFDNSIFLLAGLVEVRLQDMFPSEQRATLISVESFTFSCIMIVLSPLAGLFFEWW